MQGTRVLFTHHTTGTLAANQTITFSMPFDATLIAVSANGSNANNGIIDIGYIGALEEYVKNLDCGDSDTPAVLDEPGDFEGDDFPHILAGTLVNIGVDFDGAGGTAIHDFTLVLTFVEG